ncbi:hypothetical protein FH972_021405 [Carpinus fangiana]|uniref:Uncharacterized protein n=1 Tax=Carpinus fangiana TaxID=176857 RepID=A0A5N6KPB0_9ROSI|nr:hypothetical protein FH972_021405 [Carpinus fangiana]
MACRRLGGCPRGCAPQAKLWLLQDVRSLDKLLDIACLASACNSDCLVVTSAAKTEDVLETNIRDWREQPRGLLLRALAREVWALPPTISTKYCELYLDRYLALSNRLDAGKVAPLRHRDAIDIVNILRQGKHETRKDLVSRTRASSPSWLASTSDSAVGLAFDYAMYLWLMVTPTGWQDDQALADFMTKKFPETRPSNPRTPDGELAFNAHSLEVIGGIDLIWTSHLDEHLKLNVRASELYIFRHASLLDTHHSPSTIDVYPAEAPHRNCPHDGTAVPSFRCTAPCMEPT